MTEALMTSLLAWAPSLPELLLIVAIILLLFGSTKIPALMRGMGQGIGEFKKGLKEGDKDDEPKPPEAKP